MAPFFVLSGFVLSLRHFRDTPRPDLARFSLTGYALARVFRIWLPYLVVSVLLQKYVFTPRFDTTPAASAWLRHQWESPTTWWDFFRQADLLKFGVFELVPQAWTLAIEMVISPALPAAILMAVRSSVYLFVFMLMVIRAPLLSEYAFHFTLGILIAKHYHMIRGYLTPRLGLRCLLLVLGVLLYSFRNTLPVYLHRNLDTYVWPVTGLGAACLLLWTMTSARTQTLLNHPTISFLGRISYSIYLLHIPFLICFAPRVVALLGAWGAGGRTGVYDCRHAGGFGLVLLLGGSHEHQTGQAPGGAGLERRYNHRRA